MKRGWLCCASVAHGDGEGRALLEQQTRVKQREYTEDVKMAEVNLITCSKKPHVSLQARHAGRNVSSYKLLAV